MVHTAKRYFRCNNLGVKKHKVHQFSLMKSKYYFTDKLYKNCKPNTVLLAIHTWGSSEASPVENILSRQMDTTGTQYVPPSCAPPQPQLSPAPPPIIRLT